MGPGDKATTEDKKNAYLLGKLIAQQGWILLTGGRSVGVMQSAMEGAKSLGGLTIGILPDDNLDNMSPFVDIPILTGMGNARNNINVLSSDIIIACGMGLGTTSEISLALKSNKKVILLTNNLLAIQFFENLLKDNVFVTNSPEEVMNVIEYLLLINDSF